MAKEVEDEELFMAKVVQARIDNGGGAGGGGGEKEAQETKRNYCELATSSLTALTKSVSGGKTGGNKEGHFPSETEGRAPNKNKGVKKQDIVTEEPATNNPAEASSSSPSSSSAAAAATIRNSSRSIPGAFRQTPSTTTLTRQDSSEEEEEEEEDDSHNASDPSQQNDVNEDEEGQGNGLLVIANPVADNDYHEASDVLTLPVAHEEADTPDDNIIMGPRLLAAQRKTRILKFYLIVGVTMIVLFGIVLLVILWLPTTITGSSNVDDEDTNNIVDTGSKPTATTTTNVQVAVSPLSAFLDILPERTLRSIQANPGSPQALAYEWLMEDPYLMNYTESQQLLQRFVLATLFYAMDGPSWLQNTLWLNYTSNECSWFTRSMFGNGESLSKPPFAKYWVNNYPTTIYPCSNGTASGIYQHLWLDQLNLKGSIPEELYLLTSLQSLSLGFNPDLGGTISTRIVHLSNLEALGLLNSAHTGTIPIQVGHLTKLQSLLLQSNQFMGTLPTNLHLLADLKYFVAGYNHQLRGSLSTELGLLTKLVWFHANEAALTGTIPTQIGLWHDMTWFWIFNNTIEGTVPSQLGLLTQMTWLSCSSNPFTGTLPTELSGMSNLDIFYLRDTNLTGPIPSEYGLMSSLRGGLFLEKNSLSGTIPSDIGRLSNLITLILHDNELGGPVPSELGQMTAMEHIFVQGNRLSGTMPSQVAQLGTLGMLHNVNIRNTFLSGSIPQELCFVNDNCPTTTAWMQPPCAGLAFDCSSTLCGCSCSCDHIIDHNNSSWLYSNLTT